MTNTKATATDIHFYDFDACETLCGIADTDDNISAAQLDDEGASVTCEACRVKLFAIRVTNLITDDMAAGVVPNTVTDFQDLHDHVDANMYLESAGQPMWAEGEFDAWVRETNAITDEVSRRLAARAV